MAAGLGCFMVLVIDDNDLVQPEIRVLEKSCSRAELLAALTHSLQNDPYESAYLE